jgi:signal transduction histidine kinase
MNKKEYIKIEPLREIVTAALEQGVLYRRSEVLKHIAAAVNAHACVIWEQLPSKGNQPNSSGGNLFVSDRWLKDGHVPALHDVPLKSVAAKTVLSQETINVVDANTDSRVSEELEYLQKFGIRTLLSVPLAGAERGALQLYRKQPVPFSAGDVELAQQLALLFLLVNETIRGKVKFDLTSEVDRIFSQANLNKYTRQGREQLKKALNEVIEKICKLCSDTFNAVETSIFLDDRVNSPRAFNLIASTRPSQIEKATIHPHDVGHTSWVLLNKKSLWISDITNLENDQEYVLKDNTVIYRHNSLNIQDTAHDLPQISPEEHSSPLSFMACPILVGEKVIGVIRCYISKSGSYFNLDAISFLELVAAKVGKHWTDWIKELEVQEENKLWQRFSLGFSELNTFALRELNCEQPDANQIYAKAMTLVESVIKGVDAIDIRLLDENKPELFTAAVYGDAWRQDASTQATHHQMLRLPINEAPLSAGAYVMKTGKVIVIGDVSPNPDLADTTIFPSAKRMIIAPIKIEDQIFGVLDIRVKDDSTLPGNAAAIVELVGLQLGLYHYLIINIGRLRAAEVRLNAQVKERVQALGDLAHQLRGPINQAYVRIESVLNGDGSEDLSAQLVLIRGLFRKARRVTSSIGLYAALAGDRPIKVDLSVLDYEYLIKMLTETATDCQMLIESNRNIRVHVDQSGFEQLRRVRVEVDKNLLEQAIGNILDNALKYSFGNSVVNVSGGLDKPDRFYISVTNVGLPIEHADVGKVVERGWRSKAAELTTGEGSGIGLWIVTNIMKGHGGELEITPTTSNHVTEVKLLFQVQGR